MSESTPIPVLKVLDSEPVGFCEPDSDYCEVPGLRAEGFESADETEPAAQEAERR